MMATPPAPDRDPLQPRSSSKKIGLGTLKDLHSVSAEKIAGILHEFEIYKAELESQNLELRESQREIEAARNRFQILYDHSPAGYLTLDEAGVIKEANDPFCSLLGPGKSSFLNKPLQSLLAGPSADEIYFALRDLKSGRERDLRMFQFAGRPGRWYQADFVPLRLQGEDFQILCMVTDRTDHEMAKISSAEGEARLRMALEAAKAGTWEWNLQTGGNTWSDELWKLYRLDPAAVEPSYDAWFQSIDPEQRASVAEAVRTAASSGGELRVEWRVNNPDGPARWLMSRGRPRLNAEGQVESYMGIVLDITDRKLIEEELTRSLHEKDMLLKEVHHRVKNNLQVLSSLINLQLDTQTWQEGAESLRLIQNRVHSISLVHERLYRSSNISAVDIKGYVHELIQQIACSYEDISQSVHITLDVEDVTLGVDKAIPLGLLLTELVSNAYKHAFTPEKRGELTVAVHIREGICTVQVSDDGPGMPEGFRADDTKTMGMQLVTALASQLRGAFTIAPCPGTRFEVEFPV